MRVNDDLLSRYQGAYNLILKGYVDKSLLQTIDSLKGTTSTYNSKSFNVLGHICELIKADLALAIWKVYYDDHPDATAIKRININLRANHIQTSVKLSVSNKAVENKLKTIRNEVIAHSDYKTSLTSIDLRDLFMLLDEICTMYNGLCSEVNDTRIHQITDQDINSIAFSSKFGFGLLLGGHGKTTGSSLSKP